MSAYDRSVADSIGTADSLISTLQNKRQSLTSEIRRNVYHVDRNQRPAKPKNEPPKNSIFLATKAALEQRNSVDTSYLASFNNFLKYADGNESDESAESEKPAPIPKPKAKDTNKYGQLTNLLLGNSVKKPVKKKPELSEEEQFKLAVAKAKAAARARAAKEESKKAEALKVDANEEDKQQPKATGLEGRNGSAKKDETKHTGIRLGEIRSATKSELSKSLNTRVSSGFEKTRSASLTKSLSRSSLPVKALSASSRVQRLKEDSTTQLSDGPSKKPNLTVPQKANGVPAPKPAVNTQDNRRTGSNAVTVSPQKKETDVKTRGNLKIGSKAITVSTEIEKPAAVRKDTSEGEKNSDESEEDEQEANTKPKMSFQDSKSKYKPDSDHDEEWEEIEERIRRMTPTLDSILDTHPEVIRRRTVHSAPPVRQHERLHVDWMLKDESKRRRSPTPPPKRKIINKKEQSPYLGLPINFIMEIKKSKKDQIRKRLLRAEREKRRAKIRALEAKNASKQQSVSKRSLRSEGRKSLHIITESPEQKIIVGKSGLSLKEAALAHSQRSAKPKQKSEKIAAKDGENVEQSTSHRTTDEKAAVDKLTNEKSEEEKINLEGSREKLDTEILSDVNQSGTNKEQKRDDKSGQEDENVEEETEKKRVGFKVGSADERKMTLEDESGWTDIDTDGKGYTTGAQTTGESDTDGKKETKKRRRLRKTRKTRPRAQAFEPIKTKKLHYSLVDTPYVSIPLSNIYSQSVRKRMAEARERGREQNQQADGYETDPREHEESMFCPMCNHTTTDIDHAMRAELRLSKRSVTSKGNITKPKFYKVKYQPKYEDDAEMKLQKLIHNLETGAGYISDGESKKHGSKQRKSKSKVLAHPTLPGQLMDDEDAQEERVVNSILTPRPEKLEPVSLDDDRESATLSTGHEADRLSVYSQEGSKSSRLCNTCSSLLEIAKSDAGSMRSFAALDIESSRVSLQRPNNIKGVSEMPDAQAVDVVETEKSARSNQDDLISVSTQRTAEHVKPKQNLRQAFASLSLTKPKKAKPGKKSATDKSTDQKLDIKVEDMDGERQTKSIIPKQKQKGSRKKQNVYQLKIPTSTYGVIPVNRSLSKERSGETKKNKSEAKESVNVGGRCVDDEKDIDTSLALNENEAAAKRSDRDQTDHTDQREDNARGRNAIRSSYQHRSRVVRSGFSFRKSDNLPVKTKKKAKSKQSDSKEHSKLQTDDLKPQTENSKPPVVSSEPSPNTTLFEERDHTELQERETSNGGEMIARKYSALSLISRASSCDSRSKEISPPQIDETLPKAGVIKVKPVGVPTPEVKRRNIDMDKIHRDVQHTPYATNPEFDNIYSPQFKRKMALQNKIREIKAKKEKETTGSKQTRTAKHK